MRRPIVSALALSALMAGLSTYAHAAITLFYAEAFLDEGSGLTDPGTPFETTRNDGETDLTQDRDLFISAYDEGQCVFANREIDFDGGTVRFKSGTRVSCHLIHSKSSIDTLDDVYDDPDLYFPIPILEFNSEYNTAVLGTISTVDGLDDTDTMCARSSSQLTLPTGDSARSPDEGTVLTSAPPAAGRSWSVDGRLVIEQDGFAQVRVITECKQVPPDN